MYSNKLSALQTLKKEDTLKSLLNELRMYEGILKATPRGQEGAASIPKLIVGVVDVFIRIGNTVKTNVSKFKYKLKRSELRYFTESNALKVAKIEDTPYARLINVKVYAPTGMNGPYLPAVDSVSELYTLLALTDTLKPLVARLGEVEKMLKASNNEVSNILHDLATSAKNREKLIEEAVKSNKKIFTTKGGQAKKEFKTLYKDMAEFKAVKSRLIELEPHLRATADVSDIITNVDTQMTSLTSYLNECYKEINKSFVEDLISVVKYLGLGFDVQGNTALQQMALEHNHVLNLNELYRHI